MNTQLPIIRNLQAGERELSKSLRVEALDTDAQSHGETVDEARGYDDAY